MHSRFTTPLGVIVLTCCIGCAPEGALPGDAALDSGSLAAALEPPAAGPWFVIDDGTCGITHRDLSGPTATEGKRYLLDCVGQGIAVLDADGDGRLDLYFAQGRGADDAGPARSGASGDGGDCANRLYRNLGGRRFVECGVESGVADRGYGFGALAFDYDSDGDSDLFVTNFGPNRLFRNDGGRFVDVTAQHAGLAGGERDWSTGSAAGDVDGDGDLDLYVCRYVRHDPEELDRRGLCRFMTECRVPCGPLGLDPQPDAFFRNGGPPDYRFSEATADAGLAQPPAYGFQPLFTDVDADGDSDLYVTNDSQPNFLFLNDGTGHFSEVGMAAGVACGNAGQAEAGMGVACGDLQGDGLPELYVTNFSTQTNSLYVNRTAPGSPPWFDEQSKPSGAGVPTYFKLAWGCEIADFDDDGWPDIFSSSSHVYPQVDACPPDEIVYRQRNDLFRRVSGDRLRLEDWGARAGALCSVPGPHRASVVADLDDDGRLDLVVSCLDEPPLIAWNDSRGAGHWLALTVEVPGRTPGAPARLALGARVLAQSGERRWSGEVHAGSSFLSTEDPRVHLGLGDVAVVERLSIHFPGGTRVDLRDVAADRHLRIRAGEPPLVEVVPRPGPDEVLASGAPVAGR